MDFFALIFIIFFIFVLCSLCGFCCKKEEEGAVYSTPVVITSATHQPPGGPCYPIQTDQTTIITSIQQPVAMPMPYNNQSGFTPYPPTGGAPYPPVNNAAPGYPPSAASPGYPPAAAASAPYPTMNPNMNPAMMNPPSYNEIMGNAGAPLPQQQPPNAMNTDFYQKQSPYNPGYSG